LICFGVQRASTQDFLTGYRFDLIAFWLKVWQWVVVKLGPKKSLVLLSKSIPCGSSKNQFPDTADCSILYVGPLGASLSLR
jgi:hypothetical protein